MNPGAVEEAGKAAGTFMTVMKDQPLALALCLMNVLLLALFFYIYKTNHELRLKQLEVTQTAQTEVQRLLFSCVPSPKNPTSGEYRLQSDESRPVELPPLPRAKPEDIGD